jgi:hypothetical protein
MVEVVEGPYDSGNDGEDAGEIEQERVTVSRCWREFGGMSEAVDLPDHSKISLGPNGVLQREPSAA